MISPVYDIKGPDSIRFLNSICTNNFSKLGDNGLRHAILCNEKGQIMTDGVVIKIARDHYRTYWLNPPIDFLLRTSGMDVRGEDLSFQEYFIQISGERSLEILERACASDLHDIRFATHRMTQIGGKSMRVVRLGMSGNLAYEVHGPIAEFEEIYQRLWAAGQHLGARKLGMNAYSGPNHTPGGYPNIHIHYPLPWYESDEDRYRGLNDYLRENPQLGFFNQNRRITGSVGPELQQRFVNPFELGWGKLVRLDKPDDFPGRAALASLGNKPGRTVVTLEWNAEDFAAVYATQLMGRDVTPCEPIDAPLDMYYQANAVGFARGEGCIYRADWVQASGRNIGISSGRVVDYYYNRMISLGFIDPSYAREGNELEVLWGTPGTPQRRVRVRVAPFPFHDSIRNEVRDVADVPRIPT